MQRSMAFPITCHTQGKTFAARYMAAPSQLAIVVDGQGVSERLVSGGGLSMSHHASLALGFQTTLHKSLLSRTVNKDVMFGSISTLPKA